MLFSCVHSQNMPLFCLLRRSGGFMRVYIRLWRSFALWLKYGLLWHVTIKQAASVVAVFPSVRIFADLRRFSRVPCMCPFFAVFRFYGRSVAYGGISWFPALCSACDFRMLSGLCRVSVFLCSVRGTFGSFPALCPFLDSVRPCVRGGLRWLCAVRRFGLPSMVCGLAVRLAVVPWWWLAVPIPPGSHYVNMVGAAPFLSRIRGGTGVAISFCRQSPGFRQTAGFRQMAL